ncbi:MAG: 30S ribosomal protein S16 [Candidatus Nealsonbacteria bacterium]|nr:30S ribosomal protein S16 [Candidatus Nealsonbacteria bacterium]
MLVIRFFRVGKKNQPFFKVIVTDKRRPSRGGRFVEQVGFYNPLKKEKILKSDRIKYWLSKGAKPSNTVYNLLIQERILEGKKIGVHKRKKSSEKPPENLPKNPPENIDKKT